MLSFSVITPSYNQGHFIEKTIQSVIDQKYPVVEYILVDGGSTDNTMEVVGKFKEYFHTIISEKDNGQSDALNKGLKRATGDIIAWINSDDYYEKDTFLTVANEFEQNPNIHVIIGNCLMHWTIPDKKPFLDKPGNVDFRRMTRYWKPSFCPPQPAIFFRRSVFEKVGYLDESLRFSMDLDFWLRLARRFEFKYIDQLFAHYLLHDQSKSGSGNGFEKFMPEWRKVTQKHILRSNPKEMYLYFRERYKLKE